MLTVKFIVTEGRLTGHGFVDRQSDRDSRYRLKGPSRGDDKDEWARRRRWVTVRYVSSLLKTSLNH